MLFLTVPTRGSHPELLDSLVTTSGIARKNVIVVRTDPAARTPDGVTVVDDFGDINIQRWWNLGIDEAVARGATVVAVSNDDAEIDGDTIEQLHRALLACGATIATPGRRHRLHRGNFSVEKVLNGALWLIHVGHGLRADESYRWAYGDDELDLQARRYFKGVVSTPVKFCNVHLNEATSASPMLSELSKRDERRFRENHPQTWLARMPRALVRRLGRRAASALGLAR